MDFRYTVRDRWHGEFHLDFCGALMAVEPMGEDYVRGMYHDIEGPTFDATAVATNPKGSGAADPPGSPSSSASRGNCLWRMSRQRGGFRRVALWRPVFSEQCPARGCR